MTTWTSKTPSPTTWVYPPAPPSQIEEGLCRDTVDSQWGTAPVQNSTDAGIDFLATENGDILLAENTLPSWAPASKSATIWT